MTVEQYLEKYNNYIRGLIYKRADSDYRDDAYQEVVMQIIKYKDKLDSLDNDAARCAYICKIAKYTAFPQKRSDEKLKTYGDFTASDDDDATDPEEWLLEDDTLRPDNKVDLAKRAWAEEIIEVNERLKALKKCVNKVKFGFGLNQHRIYGEYYKQRAYEQKKSYRLKNRDTLSQKRKEYYYSNHNKILEQKRKYRETHREQIRERDRLYKQRKKEQRNEQSGHVE